MGGICRSYNFFLDVCVGGAVAALPISDQGTLVGLDRNYSTFKTFVTKHTKTKDPYLTLALVRSHSQVDRLFLAPMAAA